MRAFCRSRRRILVLWALIVPALVLVALSMRSERARARYVRAKQAGASSVAYPPATLIVPVKGHDEGLAENLASHAAQDYPDFELIVATRSSADIPDGVLPERARLVLAGPP